MMPLPPEKRNLKSCPSALADDRRSVDVAGAVLCVVAIEEQLAVLVDGVDDAVAAGEEKFEVRPSAQADDGRSVTSPVPFCVLSR